MKKPWKALRSTKRTWKALEALASPNPVTCSQCTKQPRQTKEKHDPCDTDEQSDGSFLVHLFFGTAKSVLSVLDEDSNHHDKNDGIEKQDDKNGTQKSSKEYCRIRDEAAI